MTDEPVRQLTERQIEICDALLKGVRASAIARDLGISIYTVRKHISDILRKYDVNSQAELILKLLNGRETEPHTSNGNTSQPPSSQVDKVPPKAGPEYLLVTRADLEEIVRSVTMDVTEQIVASFVTKMLDLVTTSIGQAYAKTQAQ